MTPLSFVSPRAKNLPTQRRIAAIVFWLLAVFSSGAATLLDDTFADGTRNNQNLPTDAAWYVSTPSDWTTTTGSMALATPSSAILGVSYFGANSSSPVSLAVGDTLSATIKFTFAGVAAGNTSGSFKIGIFDFADSTLSPKWATADLSSNSGQGSGVAGYALFQSFGATFNNGTPMNLLKRTTTSDSSLLGTSGDFTTLGSGPGSTNGFGGFVAGTQYSLQLSVTRSNATTLVISATWQNVTNSSSSLTWSVVDTGATSFNFDGIGFRPAAASSTASTITFNEVRVDYTNAGAPASVSSSSPDVSVYVGQNANFSVVAGGSAPLIYQWYFNTNTALAGATNSTLALTNLQTTNSGAYFCIVTNSFGSDTSAVANLTVTIPDAPSIITQPQNQNISPGGSATFTVTAGGSEPFSYQWYYNTNTVITNATGSTLIITNVQPAVAGSYSVTVSNLAGGITSTNAFLTINNTPVAPVFISQPASQVVLAGGTASFSAVATGTAPIAYQWNKNGIPISGATSSTLNVTNVQATDSGSIYTVTASNSVNSVTSGAAVLTVTTTVPVANTEYNLTGFATVARPAAV